MVFASFSYMLLLWAEFDMSVFISETRQPLYYRRRDSEGASLRMVEFCLESIKCHTVVANKALYMLLSSWA